jgi:hypothetical protein
MHLLPPFHFATAISIISFILVISLSLAALHLAVAADATTVSTNASTDTTAAEAPIPARYPYSTTRRCDFELIGVQKERSFKQINSADAEAGMNIDVLALSCTSRNSTSTKGDGERDLLYNRL